MDRVDGSTLELTDSILPLKTFLKADEKISTFRFFFRGNSSKGKLEEEKWLFLILVRFS